MDKRKKIALVNVFFPPQAIGGATRVISDNFDVLIQEYGDEFEIVVFTTNAEHQEESYRLDNYIYKGQKVYRTSVTFRENMDWHSNDLEMGELFRKFLDFEKPDLVHFHCIQRLSGNVVEVCIQESIPYYITLHDAWWISDFQFLVDAKGKVYPEGHIDPKEEIKLPKSITKEASFKRKVYLKKLLSKAEKNFSVSDSFMKIYNKNDIDNVVVIKNGISKKVNWSLKDTTYSAKVVCGHIGGMSAHKGYDILKDAVMKTQPTDIEFLIVDHSKDESYKFESFWGKVPVKFIGQVRQDNIVELYQKLDVLLAPSTWPESFGLVTREASACGCWVVAGNLGGIGEDVIENETGFVIDPTKNGISEVLIKMDKDVKRFKSNTIDHQSLYFVNQQVSNLVKFFKD